MCELQKLATRILFSIQEQMLRLLYKVTAREKQQDAEEDVEYFVDSNLDSSVIWVDILCTHDIFSTLMLILLLYFD
jgi:hypothetical protein